MSTVTRPIRALAIAPLLIAMLLAMLPSPVAALEPPRPLPGYRPHFVTETDDRPMIDCLWASGAMLIAKWTNGRIHPTHQRLRALSGDRSRGSNLDDLKIAYRKLGINLQFSPDGGNRITFNGLLRRLAHGAGAVVLGDDSKLPALVRALGLRLLAHDEEGEEEAPVGRQPRGLRRALRPAPRPGVADGSAGPRELPRRMDQRLGAAKVRMEQRRRRLRGRHPEREARAVRARSDERAPRSAGRRRRSRPTGRSGPPASGTSRASRRTPPSARSATRCSRWPRRRCSPSASPTRPGRRTPSSRPRRGR